MKRFKHKKPNFIESLEVEPPRTLEDMIDECDGCSSYRNDRNRPYDGQPHTTYGQRGKTKIKNITFRDLRDCYIKAWLLASGDSNLYNKAANETWLPKDIYLVDMGNVDPVAIAQCLGCEVEKLMGIYPNVQPIRKRSRHD